MDYYESVVVEYLRADRTLFVNTEYCIQLNEADNPDNSGPHWYCDAVAISFKEKAAYLCEMTYSDPPSSLYKRLEGWAANWQGVERALKRDGFVPNDWSLRPWIFTPEKLVGKIDKRFRKTLLSDKDQSMPIPRITTLEMVQPWLYRSWNRNGEKKKPDLIPPDMR